VGEALRVAPGWATKNLRLLCPCVRALCVELVGTAKVHGIRVAVVETLRDLPRQRYYAETGVSRTLASPHLPQPPNQLSLAFDLVPREYLPMKLWNPGGELWTRLGALAGDLGLMWGGDWRRWKDRPHFYLDRCRCKEG